MDIVLQQNYSPVEIQRINACRLFKQVTMVSDIATIDGTMIQECMLHSSKPVTTAKVMFPYQLCPNRGSWNLWKAFLFKLCSDRLRLRETLGRWLVSGDSLSRQWNEYHNYSGVYIFNGTKYEKYSRRGQFYISESRFLALLPDDCLPCVLEKFNDKYKMLRSSRLAGCMPPMPYATFTDYILQLPSWQNELLQNIVMDQDAYTTIDIF